MQKEIFELKTQKVKRICIGKEEGEDRETFEQQGHNIKVTFIYPETILVNVKRGKQSLSLKSVYVKSDILFFSGKDLVP